MNLKSMSTPELFNLVLGISQEKALLLLNDRPLATLASEDYRNLKSYDGVTVKRSEKIGAIMELCKRLNEERLPHRPRISEAMDVYKLMNLELRFLQTERFVVVLLGGRNEVLKKVTISTGTRSCCQVYSQKIFKEALLEDSTAIILVHNHPSGDPSPSPEDCSMTRKVVSQGRLLGIQVLDHVIIGDGTYKSLREEGIVE